MKRRGFGHSQFGEKGEGGKIGMGSAISKGKGRGSSAAAAASASSSSSSLSSEWISSGRDAAHSPGDGMGSPSAPSSQSRGDQGSFHVFLTFRGPDVRNTFLSHLHHALGREGIRTYVDCEDLQSGDEITPSLKNAIRNSRIAVVIFSVNYASSRWCLEELAEIMDRRKQGKLVVKPVFYRMEAREARTPRHSFAKALAAHESKLGKDSDMLRRWKEALSEAGNLSGWHLDANG